MHTLYSDELLEIGPDSIRFRHYYFPWGAKRILLRDIEQVEVLDPTLLSGKWRAHGTGDFRTWFPRDLKRHTRDAIFIITYRTGWWRTGFTAVNPGEVRRFFESRGLIKPAAAGA